MDNSKRIVAAVRDAGVDQRRLSITGAGSKGAWLPTASGEMLTMTEHTGIVTYDPAELVVTVRAGTTIKDLVAELAHAGQMLAFEPPQFHDTGTVGGMVSSGLSGPARPWGGSVRDAVLGVELVNGIGEHLRFGGQVMKNVAGYDVSRLATGAFGALGAILQVSLRVQPISEQRATVVFELDPQTAIDQCRKLAQSHWPVSASWWIGGQLHVRLSGSAVGVAQAAEQLGGKRSEGGEMWAEVRDHNLAFFKAASMDSVGNAEQKLWRIIVPPASPVAGLLAGDATAMALEWGGGLRWLWHDDADLVARYTRDCNGWAWALGESMPIEQLQKKYMRAIKQAFDPAGLFASPLDFGSGDED